MDFFGHICFSALLLTHIATILNHHIDFQNILQTQVYFGTMNMRELPIMTRLLMTAIV